MRGVEEDSSVKSIFLFFILFLFCFHSENSKRFSLLAEINQRLLISAVILLTSCIYVFVHCYFLLNFFFQHYWLAVSTPQPTGASNFLLALKLTFCVSKHMSPKRTLNHSRSLKGVHGVQVAPHSPFVLTETNQNGDLHPSTSGTSATEANQLLLMQRIWQQRPACLRSIHSSTSNHGDLHLAETVANVLTSIPFIALGMHAPRKNLSSKLYANSLIGVGVASSMYHSSRGRLRKYLRWVDYTMIATATICLSRALRNENPKLLMAASAVFLPVQPLMVSAIHTGMMEVAFARRALKDPDLRMAHTVHKMSSVLGGMLFVADDLFPTTPYLHAAWHLAAAVGVGTCNKLLE